MHRQHPLETAATELDRLLELVAIQLQLTATQYQEAERSYRAVGEWLSAPGSRLHPFAPDIIPQGSMALGTTVKPRKREEFDVDLVCRMELDRTLIGPTQVYRMVADRIREHATYRTMLRLKDRCLRLDYAGQFHLDVIPAAPDPRLGVPFGSLSLVIPDKQQARWVPTNPEGFRAWFQSRAVVAGPGLIRLSVEPLPPHEERGSKTVLQRVVQLFKRRRDVHFNGYDFEPRSILITTIDGMLYAGQQSLSDAINSILDGLIAWGTQYRDVAPPIIPNPTNADENLARHWREDRRHFESFVEYAVVFRSGMDELAAATTLVKRAEILKRLFDPDGSGVVNEAVRQYADIFQEYRAIGDLGMTKTGPMLATVTAVPAARRFRNTSFYGAVE